MVKFLVTAISNLYMLFCIPLTMSMYIHVHHSWLFTLVSGKPFSKASHHFTHHFVVFVDVISMCTGSCPLHISRSDSLIGPRCRRLGQCEWVFDPTSAVRDSSGDPREVVGRSELQCVQCNFFSEGVVIN